jgi:hypothetical protein
MDTTMQLSHRTLTWLIGLLCALLAFQGSVMAVHLLARSAHHATATDHQRPVASAHTANPHTHAPRATDDCGAVGHCVSAAQPVLASQAPQTVGGVVHGLPFSGEERFSSAHPQTPEPRPKRRHPV